MRIAVIDIAASNGGALSVLRDFYNYLLGCKNSDDEWFFFISDRLIEPTDNIHCFIEKETKRSWIKRLIWDNFTFKKISRTMNFDVVFSLQNAAVSTKCKQFVYFHNVLLITKHRFSFFRRSERKYAIYSNILSKYTLRTYRHVEGVFFQTNTSRKMFFNKYKRSINSFVVNPNVSVESMPSSSTDAPIGFIYPANPEAFKNHHLIIEAARILKEEGFEPEIIFTFTENASSVAENIFYDASDLKNITFSGYLSREMVLRNYSQYALIWASSIESYPIPFQEIRIAGQYAILPKEDYALEIMSNYENSLFYDIGDAKDLARQMKKALTTPLNKTQFTKHNNSWERVVRILKGESDDNDNYSDIQ